MADVFIEPDAQGEIRFSQESIDDNGDPLQVVSVILLSIDGVPVDPADQNPVWLSYTTSEEIISYGRNRLTISFIVDTDYLDATSVYQIQVEVNDGVNPSVTGTFEIKSQEPGT